MIFLGGEAGGVALDGVFEIVLHGKQGVAFAVGAALTPVDATLFVALELLLYLLGCLEALGAGDFHYLGIEWSYGGAEANDVFVGGGEAAADVEDVLGFGGEVFGNPTIANVRQIVGHPRKMQVPRLRFAPLGMTNHYSAERLLRVSG